MGNKSNKVMKISDIKVRSRRGMIPFSIGYLADTLLKIGITEDLAFNHANSISKVLLEKGKKEVSTDEVFEEAIAWYKEYNKDLADRLKVVSNDFRDYRPIIILLGGVTGIGKSTLAAQLAKRLDVRSIMGSDLIREVMRLVISNDLMPTLHASSYVAFKELEDVALPAVSPTVLGFEEQARKVTTGIEAVITQTIKEMDFAILEGVHLIPGIIRPLLFSSANIIQLLLCLDDEDEHMSRLIRREKTAVRSTTYSNYFKEIREIQEYLLVLAEKHNITTVEVSEDEHAITTILDTIWSQLLAKSNGSRLFAP